MKKIIQKPENWQDFESLCKKLWGEIWGIPMKIKKNGRTGQLQAGVDIYGVPNGEIDYWGIQCKGKDEYTDAKLTRREINEEIIKAKSFKPKLKVLIFASSMNKDSSIEEYVREKDIESTRSGGFEILLYCWEDIADLIDENRDTYNYYVNNQQYKSRFDFKILLNNFQEEFTIKPKCVRTIKKYRLSDYGNEMALFRPRTLGLGSWNDNLNPANISLITQGKINEAICSFEIIMINEGSVVIEDWRVTLEITGEYIEFFDQLGTGPMGMINLMALKYKRTYVEDGKISYTPKDNEPLIQKDNRYFEAHIIPKFKEYIIPIQWKILARDYNTSGKIYIKVEPEYEDKIIYEYINSVDELKEDEVISVEAKKNYKDNN
ncbi:hypothetical protein [Hymenobacter nivis]|uniref:hypothetical protein n=1 Tax=Hymenobacter nivis TaxID=1850093 RepID=UPI0013A5839A|nr:hypothetical protein [Hymenobacter nivis]